MSQVLCGKLFCGQLLLTCLTKSGQAKLTHLTCLCRRQLFGRKTILGGKLLRRQPCLSRQLLGGHTKLAELTSLGCRELLC